MKTIVNLKATALILLLMLAVVGCEKRRQPIGQEYFYAFNGDGTFGARGIDIERRDEHGRFVLVYPGIYASAGDTIEHNRIVIFCARSAEPEAFEKVAVLAASATVSPRNIAPLLQRSSDAGAYKIFKDFRINTMHKLDSGLEVVLVSARYVPELPSSLSIKIPWTEVEDYLRK